jgi:hypothetical protein
MAGTANTDSQKTETKPEAPATTPETKPEAEVDWQAKYEEMKRHARTWEDRAKANEDAQKRLSEIEDANKTELQKAQERAEAAEKELTSTRTESLRHKIASEKGVPAALLTGADEDALTAQAEQLLAFRGEQSTTGALHVPGEGATDSGVAATESRDREALAILGF